MTEQIIWVATHFNDNVRHFLTYEEADAYADKCLDDDGEDRVESIYKVKLQLENNAVVGVE